MNIGDQSGSGPSGDFSQHLELSRDNLPIFADGRQQSPDPEEASMFVDQDSGSSSVSPKAQNQPEPVVLDDPEDDPHNGPEHEERQRNDGSDFPEQPGDNNENEHSDLDELVDLVQQDLIRGASIDIDEDSEEDRASRLGKSSDCASCKALKGRLRRLEKGVASKLNIITQKNLKLGRLLTTILRLRLKLREKDAEIERLRGILRLNHIDPDDRSNRVRSVPNPNATMRAPPGAWKNDVRNFYNSSIDDNGNYNPNAWEEVWKAQYKQSNISINLTLLHPDIRLGPPEDSHPIFSTSSRDSASTRSSTPFDPAPAPPNFEGFNKLPNAILIKVLHEILLFSGQVVHIFSRLDPYEPSADSRTAQRLPGRIYISNGVRACISLTRDTLCPRRLLSPLCVNRKWHFFGAHIFYGTNTFAFSSFGEFGRFCRGIGQAKLQRIANLEIHWQGGTCVGTAEDGKDWRRTKEYRIMPVAYLPDMRSLDTLVIFIDESPMRRPWEDKSMIQALRVCRGWDYLHMLRNLSWIRLYDTAKMNMNYQRNSSAVRDRSAVEDLNRTARMENTPEKAEECRLTSLQSLVPHHQGKWAPGEDDYQLLLSILDRPHLEVNDLDDFDRGSDREDETGSENDSESDSDGDEDEDEDDGVDGNGIAGDDLREDSFRPKSEPVVIDVDAEDDIQIIEVPRRREWRSTSAINTRFRGETTRSESSLFVTPHPGERSTASATVSPSRRTVIDLTIPTHIKRSASSDRDEAKKRKIKADT